MISRRPCAGSAATGALIVNENVAPRPGPPLSADIVPPISSARRLLMARPSPVPPYLRVVEASAWLNFWKSLPIPSAESPMPVSRTAKVSSAVLPVTVAVTVSTTSPRSVNLMALASRLSRICRSRVTSPLTAGGTSPSNRYARSSCFCAARVPTRSSADSTHSRRSNGCASMSMRPASIFEKSRMSLMMVKSASPESRMVAA